MLDFFSLKHSEILMTSSDKSCFTFICFVLGHLVVSHVFGRGGELGVALDHFVYGVQEVFLRGNLKEKEGNNDLNLCIIVLHFLIYLFSFVY